jgi:hypothetical protein
VAVERLHGEFLPESQSLLPSEVRFLADLRLNEKNLKAAVAVLVANAMIKHAESLKGPKAILFAQRHFKPLSSIPERQRDPHFPASSQPSRNGLI